jgi:hypothetical protein
MKRLKLPKDLQSDIRSIQIRRRWGYNWSYWHKPDVYAGEKISNDVDKYFYIDWDEFMRRLKSDIVTGWRYPSLLIKKSDKWLKRIYITSENSCSCPDQIYRKKDKAEECKHIKKIKKNITINELTIKIFGDITCNQLINSYL